MSDTFLNAMNVGINLGHMSDSAKMQRLQMEQLTAQLMEETQARQNQRDFVNSLNAISTTTTPMQQIDVGQGQFQTNPALSSLTTQTRSPEFGQLAQILGGEPEAAMASQLIKGGSKPVDVIKALKSPDVTQKPLKKLETIYGPKGESMDVEVFSGYQPPAGWTRKPASESEDNLTYHIEKEQIGKEKVQDYRVFTNKKGEIVKREPIGKPYTNTEGVARVRIETFGSTPTATPGIVYDKIKKRFFEIGADGSQRPMTSEEVKVKSLEYKEQIPTNDIKVMQQSVPSVLQLLKQSRTAMDSTLTSLGPLRGRWSELWAGKIGAANPEFVTLKTDLGLLQTRLMKMHVGARGGEYIMKHFQDMLDSGKSSPENLKAAMDAIEMYAGEVKSSIVEPPKEQTPGVNNPQSPVKPVTHRLTIKNGKWEFTPIVQ